MRKVVVSLALAGLVTVAVLASVPAGANPDKLAAMRELGAELIAHGRDYDEAREHCEALAAAR